MEALNMIDRPPGNLVGSRRAALFMHSVSEQDQRWLLERLPESELKVLTPLLAELKELGIPKNGFMISNHSVQHEDAGVAHDDVRTNVPCVTLVTVDRTAVLTDATESEQLQFLDETANLVLRGVLESEPTEVLVCVLNLHSWKWRVSFLEEFDVARRFQLRDRLEKSTHDSIKSLPTKFRRALLKSLIDRVQDFEKTTLSSERAESKVENKLSLLQRISVLFER